jgi:hypothetical protein
LKKPMLIHICITHIYISRYMKYTFICIHIQTLCTLIDWLFTVLRPAQEFFSYMETSPLPVKGCKIYAYARRSGPLSRDLYRATPAVTRDLGFSGLIRRTAPFSRLLWHTRGCGGSILTRILTGQHCVHNAT